MDRHSTSALIRKRLLAPVVGAPDARDAPVGGDHQDGRELVLQRPVQEAEALHVQHVDLRGQHQPRSSMQGTEQAALASPGTQQVHPPNGP